MTVLTSMFKKGKTSCYQVSLGDMSPVSGLDWNEYNLELKLTSYEEQSDLTQLALQALWTKH